MRIIETELDGCFDLQPMIHKDQRGRFVKMFQHSQLHSLKVGCDFMESYYSVSRKNVLRGLHFQLPPGAHSKMVYCIDGAIWDVVLDVRKDSKTFGRYHATELSLEEGNGVFVREGFAHGFLTLSNSATVLYFVTSEYDVKCDSGILWNSAGIAWPVEYPIVSSRDSGFVPMSEFQSPFLDMNKRSATRVAVGSCGLNS
jgi:dTDP-4-dehydrorhamnose 3,5-epimerase